MGIQLKDSSDDIAEVSEINVTPFIDVVLVLLIIFMVAAPLSTVDVEVDLPSSNSVPQDRPDEPLYLTVRGDLTLALGEETVGADRLAAVLDETTGGNREERIFLRADSAVAYGDLMGVMNDLRAAGYLRIALVGLQDASQPAVPAASVGQPGAPAAPIGETPAQ